MMSKQIFFILIIIFSQKLIYAQFESVINISGNNEFTSSNLPIIVINTNGNEIVDEYRIEGHMGVIFNNLDERNFITDPFNNYDGKISIELRGSSSISYPKKQYRIETQDSSGENFNTSLCGLPSENDWILNGPYNDKTLIRNFFAYSLSRKIGRYASRTVFCELLLNNEFMGLYVLLETVKRDNNRVNIAKLEEANVSGDDITGGYIVKIDKMDGENIDFWNSKFGTLYQYHYPKPDEINESQKNYIKSYMNNFEDTVSENIDDIQNFIDFDSFIDHFILNEFCKNVDAYRLSSYLYKDKDSENRKIFAGPIWDFNLTFGDAWNDEDLGVAEGWQVDYSKKYPFDPYKVPFWWELLSNTDTFNEKLSLRWYKLRENVLSVDSIFTTIDSLSNSIKEARIRNFDKWNWVLGDNTYEFEILKLKSWILRRLAWLDENIEEITSLKNIASEQFNAIKLYQNYPNPFNPKTTIKYSIPTSVNSSSLGHDRALNSEISPNAQNGNVNISLKVYDILGREVTTLVTGHITPGNYEIEFDASNLVSGIYTYTLIYGNYYTAKKMIVLK